MKKNWLIAGLVLVLMTLIQLQISFFRGTGAKWYVWIILAVSTIACIIGLLVLFLKEKKTSVPTPTPRTPPPPKNREGKESGKNKWESLLVFHFFAWGILAVIFLLAITLNEPKEIYGGLKINWANIIWAVEIVCVLLSIRKIGPDEIGVRTIFGRPLHNLKSGPVLIPWLICQLETFTRLTRQIELPGAPEKAYHPKLGVDPETIPENLVKEGYFKPALVTFGIPGMPPKPQEYSTVSLSLMAPKQLKRVEREIEAMRVISDTIKEIKKHEKPGKDGTWEKDPYNQRMTAEIFLLVRYRIFDPKQFLTTVETVEKLDEYLQDNAIGTASRNLAKITPAVALKHLGHQNILLHDELEERIGNWGVELLEVQIKTIAFSHDINNETLARAKAEATSKATAVLAQGTKQKLKLEGEGEAAAIRAKIDARKDGIGEMSERLHMDPTTVLAADTARAVADGTNEKLIILGGSGGMSDLIGTLAGAKKALEDKKGPTP